MDGIEIRIIDKGDLKALVKVFRLQADGKQLRLELTRGMRDALRPVLAQVKAAYRAAPSMGHESSSRSHRDRPDLRGLLAKAARLEVKTSGKRAGARIVVDGRRMPDRMRKLPQYVENARGSEHWRHPVFGDREHWVEQFEPRPTFYRVVIPHRPALERQMTEIAIGVADKIVRTP